MVKPLGEERNLDDVARFIVAGKAGDFVFREGDSTAEMYIIQDGQIEIVKQYAGEARQIAVLEAGDFFGEISLLEEQPREVSAHALTDYRLLRIDHSTFDQIVQENPEIAIRMLRKLSRRLREHQEADLRAAQIAMGALRPLAEVSKPPAAPEETPKAPAVLHARLVHSPSGTEFRLPDGAEATIGRIDRATGLAPDVDLTEVDTEKTLSRRHAKILRRGREFYLREEMGTRNGTFVNGERIKTGVEVKLNDGDRLRFGLVETVFHCR